VLSRRWAKYVALLLLAGMLIPTALALTNRQSSQGPTAEELARRDAEAQKQRCVGIATRVADQIESYVQRFDADPGGVGSSAPAVPSIPKLRSQVADLTARVGGDGCDVAVFRTALARRLESVRSSTELGAAVAGTLVANVRDVLEPGTPRRVAVPAGKDLWQAFVAVPSGSTLVLGPGTFRVDRPLVVLQDVTLTGAGPGRTRIVSTAKEAALLQPAPSHLSMSRLTLAHGGGAAASVLLLREGSARLDRVTVSGAVMRAGSDRATGAVPDLASGGNGIIAATNGRVVVSRSRLLDNEAAGLVTSAASRPQVADTVIAGNGLCGACFLSRSAASIRGSTLRQNQIGILVGDRARPTVRDNVIATNARAGVVSQQRAVPRILDNRVRGNGDIGIAVYNRSSARVQGNTVSGHRQVGIVVSTDRSADPRVVDNTMLANTRAGVAFLAEAGGTVAGNRCAGGSAGLVLGGSSRPSLSRSGSCPVRDERT
jgi:parallel beta-helix repeat protein